MLSKSMAGVIWITGLPNSGKTTFGDLIFDQLRDSGHNVPVNVIRLDGDILRVTLGASDIQDEISRHELAEKYWNLAKCLALQGNIVVVSVVAIFADILENVSSSEIKTLVIEVDSDEETLLSRNDRNLDLSRNPQIKEHLKKILPARSRLIFNSGSDDLKKEVSLAIEHYKSISNLTPVQKNSKELLKYLTNSQESIRNYWDAYYKSSKGNLEPSSFAQHVTERISSQDKILEIGCGDGRDAFFFARKCSVLGVDVSDGAIKLANLRKKQDAESNELEFQVLDSVSAVSKFIDSYNPTIVYIRFVLHAMTLDDEKKLWKLLSQDLKVGNRIFLEVRTVFDLKYNKGIHLSSNERYEGHYRRFADPVELLHRIEKYGFLVRDRTQGSTLSIVGADDPDLLRLELEKTKE